MEAMAWALFVERAWPAEAGQIEAPLPPGADPIVAAERARARIQLANLRDLIYPKD